MSKKILIVDLETTDLKHKIGHIVEVGIVELDLDTGDRNIIFDKVCHETGITKQEVETSWIVTEKYMTTKEIRHSANLESMSNGIQQIFDSYDGITAYNSRFDFGYLESRGFFLGNKLDCPMLLSTPVCKMPHKRVGKKGFKWPSCEEAYAHFFSGSGYLEKHRAADDAYHEAAIVYELYKLGVFKV